MSSDDAADFIADLSESEQEIILDMFEDDDATDVQQLMEYDDDTAGGLMTTEYVFVEVDNTAKEAIEIIRGFAPDAETIYYTYVLDKDKKLVGVLSLRELILAAENTKVADIMWENVISVNQHDDQEDVRSEERRVGKEC